HRGVVKPKHHIWEYRTKRDKPPVRIDSRDYPLVNWSATGVLIGGHKDHLAKGQRFRMQVEVTDEAEMIAFSCEGIVLRTQGEKLAAQFLSIDKNVKARIHKFFGRKGSGL
ncbi:MAG: hypothetical protein O3B74_12975, partial [Proteobacteria bacterium]|nr:hypothetical protein [Pseudomonadota bacterium]